MKKIKWIKIFENQLDDFIKVVNNAKEIVENTTYHRLIEYIILEYMIHIGNIPLLKRRDMYIEKDGAGYENIFILDKKSDNTEANLRLTLFEVKSYSPQSSKKNKKNKIKEIEDFSFDPSCHSKINEAIHDVFSSKDNGTRAEQRWIIKNNIYGFEKKPSIDRISTDFKDTIEKKLNNKKISDVNDLYNDFIFLMENKYTKLFFVGTISDNSDDEIRNINIANKEKEYEEITAIILETQESSYKNIFNKIKEKCNG